MKTIAIVAVLLAAFWMTGVGCEHGGVYVGTTDSPGYAAGYDYYYYPDNEVYYYPSGGVYYWHDGDRWNHDHRLPDRYHIDRDRDRHVNLHMNTQRPYENHDHTRVQYPGTHADAR